MTDNNSEKCYYDPSSSRAKELQKKFVYFVAVSNVTSSIVSDTAFVDFCAALDKRFKLPRYKGIQLIGCKTTECVTAECTTIGV